MHFVNFERRFPCPDQSLQCERFATSRSPAALRALIEQGTIGREFQGEAARGKAFTKRKAGALVTAIHLFQIDPHHGAVRLVAHEKLVPERSELTADIAGNAAR